MKKTVVNKQTRAYTAAYLQGNGYSSSLEVEIEEVGGVVEQAVIRRHGVWVTSLKDREVVITLRDLLTEVIESEGWEQ